VATVVADPAQSAVPPAPDIPMRTGVRTGVHPTFDRIVPDVSGPRPPASSRFFDELTHDGSGNTEWLTGAALADVYAAPGRRTTTPAPQLPGIAEVPHPRFGEHHGGCDHRRLEVVLPAGVGLRKKTWIKAFTLTRPTRMVIDVGR
jgi:hypothetical protein